MFRTSKFNCSSNSSSNNNKLTHSIYRSRDSYTGEFVWDKNFHIDAESLEKREASKNSRHLNFL